jgi:hypothetical protein
VTIAAVAISHENGFLTLILILMVILTLGVAKRRIDLDVDAIAVVPLLPFRQTHRVLWSSIGPFTSTKGRGFTVLQAPSAHPTTPNRFISLGPKDGLSLQAVYGHGWRSPALPAGQLEALLEGYRGAANPAPPAGI